MANSPYSLETQQKMAVWRQKAMEGTLTLEEQRQAVEIMRADRRNAAHAAASGARRAKAKAAIPSADAMLDELGKS